MEKFERIASTGVPLASENIDTDQIIPARFLKATSRDGFGDNLFRDWRFNPDGSVKESFPLNDSKFGGKILVAGKNFGCGSSREHAAWAILDYGFKVVISSFFADIFKSNSLNNGLLPIQLEQTVLDQLIVKIQERPETRIEVDLATQVVTVTDLGIKQRFEINSYKKDCLINGLDDFRFLVSHIPEIEAYEKSLVA